MSSDLMKTRLWLCVFCIKLKELISSFSLSGRTISFTPTVNPLLFKKNRVKFFSDLAKTKKKESKKVVV